MSYAFTKSVFKRGEKAILDYEIYLIVMGSNHQSSGMYFCILSFRIFVNCSISKHTMAVQGKKKDHEFTRAIHILGDGKKIIRYYIGTEHSPFH